MAQALTEIGIGVDTGGTKVKIGLVESHSLEGCLPKLVLVPGSAVELDSEVGKGPKHVVKNVIKRGISQSAKGAGVDMRQISAIGAGFPCAVSSAGVALELGNMGHPAWKMYQLEQAIASLMRSLDPSTPRKIKVSGDVAATVHGVALELPEDQRMSTIHCLAIGTGVGGATLIDGKNYFSNQGGGSEPGASSLIFDEDQILFDTPSFAVSRRLEHYVSLVAITRQLEKMHQKGAIPKDHPVLQLESKGDKSAWRVRAERLLSYADTAFSKGDMNDFSMRIFKLQREVLGYYLHRDIQVLRPDHIFILGGVTDSQRASEGFRNWYVDGIKQAACSHITQESRTLSEYGFPQFHTSKNGDMAAPIGAACMGLTSGSVR